MIIQCTKPNKIDGKLYDITKVGGPYRKTVKLLLLGIRTVRYYYVFNYIIIIIIIFNYFFFIILGKESQSRKASKIWSECDSSNSESDELLVPRKIIVKRIYTPETSPIKKHKKYKSQINNKEIEEPVLTLLSPPTFSIDQSKYYIIKHTQGFQKVGQQSLDMVLINNNNMM